MVQFLPAWLGCLHYRGPIATISAMLEFARFPGILAVSLALLACPSSESEDAFEGTEDDVDVPAPDVTEAPDEATGPDVEEACKTTTLVITPESPGTATPLQAAVYGGKGQYELFWFRLESSGIRTQVGNGPTLSAMETAKGLTFQVEASALAPGDCSLLTENVTIVNTPPDLTGLVVTPAAAYADQTLECTFLPEDWHDADAGDPMEPTWSWFVGEALLPETSSTLTGGFQKGDEVVCRVTPTDGESSGTPVFSEPVPILNAPPEVTSVSLPCDEPGAPIICSASGDDIDGGLIAYRFQWFSGIGECSGEPIQENPPIPGVSASELTANVAKGDVLTCCVTPRDSDGTEGSTTQSEVCVVPNQPPQVTGGLVTNASGPGPLTVGATAACTAEVSDPDGDEVALACTWFVDGSTVAEDTCELSAGFAKGQSVCCSFVADDGVSATASAAKVCQKVLDSPPSVSDVTVGPADGDHCAEIDCTGVTTDPDLDPVTLKISWKVDGEGVPGTPTAEPGQELTCVATPVADGAAGASGESSVVLGNATPTLSGATLESDIDPPGAAATLTCTPSGWADPDECDLPSFGYVWYVNGEAVLDADGPELTGAFGKQDVVLCFVAPGDGWTLGAEVASGALVIQNSPPVATFVTVTPPLGDDKTVFTCVVDGGDPDNDEVTWVYTWLVNGVVVPELSGPDVSSVPFTGIQAELTCTAQPFDGVSSGASLASANKAILLNSPPQAKNVAITPALPTTVEDLLCNAEVSDPDAADVPVATYAWLRIEASGEVLITGATGALLTSDHTAHFDKIFCRVTPTDGKLDGSPQSSAAVVIANTAPTIATVSVDPLEGTPQTSFTCKVVGYQDLDLDPANLNYQWRLDGVTVSAATSSKFIAADWGGKPGSTIGCTALPSDGFDDGVAKASAQDAVVVACNAGTDGEPCDDADPCTVSDACNFGQCLGVLADCDDDNPCTSDECVPGVGCESLSVAEGEPCDDDNICTVADHCSAGFCKGGALLDCDDDNVCTADSCTVEDGCVHTPQDGTCEDGVCVGGVCCIPDCTGKICGADGCGSSCGSCAVDHVCLDPPGQCFSDLTDGMILVPPGPFGMGCVDGDTLCSSNEKPFHEVTLSPYMVDITEVTLLRYSECVDAGGCSEPDSSLGGCLWGAGADDQPVNCATWHQADEYCVWAGKRLCTAAEWEKAARGTDGRIYPWGDLQASCALAIMKEGVISGCGALGPTTVASILEAVSPYGALDMAGNISEWVSDNYSSAYYLASPSKDPKGPPFATSKSFRGGDYEKDAKGVRCSARDFLQPTSFQPNVGFRCCQDIEEP